MKKLTRLWQTLERVPGLLAVPAFWEIECGDEFDLLKPFLRSTDTLGTLHPCPFPTRSDCPRKIVDHGDGEFIAICRDPHRVCPDVRLDGRAALLHELDVVAFAKAISTTLGLRSRPLMLRSRGVWEIGLSTRGRRPVCLLIQIRQSAFLHDLRRLALEIAGRFVVLAPTEMFRDVECQQVLDSRDLTFIPLEQHIAVDSAGRFVAVDLVPPVNESERPSPARVGRPSAQTINGELVKKIRGDLKQEDFAGRWRMSVDLLQTAENQGRATKATIAKICRAAKAKGLKLKPEDLKQIVPLKPQI